MKKTLVSALTTALVVGAASTTFAAANPFSDVPADHWAYDAVSQLAADGVIEGYGDSTFQGDKSITRYEMAQMVAKAMAKTDVSAADKAMIDKLAAEFADELNNLGVRVSNLEKHADMVKWNGELRYRYWNTQVEDNGSGYSDKEGKDKLLFRLKPTAEVNDHWDVHAQLDATTDLSTDTGDDGTVKLARAWAQGNYKNFNVYLGKQDLFSNVDRGLTHDGAFSGARAQFGKDLKVNLEAGRYSTLKATVGTVTTDAAANYQGIELTYNPSKLFAGAAYRHFNSDAFKASTAGFDGYSSDPASTKDTANVWSAGLGYNFDGNWDLFGAYANNTSADRYETAHTIQLSYKGADKANKGTWGAYAAYRYLGQNVAFEPTYDTAVENTKGWEIGADYAPFTNVYTAISYYKAKALDDDATHTNVLFGRVSFFF
ncbi:MAG: S-layer homology domain-containing protein [Selenomonas sp.]|uniref:S-layer homology domain-containing protein n=1 Tax=Selenomonas sp. TaxID=2053611 RepID=UPI0025E6CD15|nr:S-layer homology domain-containing protein [Selenomonas sp.]MCI6100486.1 S-layer homology domain-containing protein [Selenomonas sp.]MCI6233136.1 S-layer homology domain-containing protein [Selenomonas sp.]